MLKIKSNRSQLLQTIFFGCLILFSIATAFNLPRLTLPLLLSYVIYLTVNPMIPALRKFGISKNVSVIILLVVLFSLFLLPLIKIIPSIESEVQRFQYYIPKVETYIREAYVKMQDAARSKLSMELDDKYLIDALSFGKSFSTRIILGLPTYAASFLEWVFIVPLFLFFLLKDGTQFKHLILKIVPNSIFERSYYLVHQFNKKIGDYIFSKFLEATIVGVIIAAGLGIMDVRFFLILGIIAGVTNVIPYVGPLLGSIPGIILASIEYGYTSSTFAAVVLLFVIANIIDMAVVFPLLVSKIVDLHPIVVVVSVILGSQYLGIMGMIISIPMAAAVKLIFLEIYRVVYANNV